MDQRSIFLEVLAKDTPEEQQAFLDASCGTGTPLRAEVESLLQAHERLGDFLERPIAVLPTQSLAPALAVTSPAPEDALPKDSVAQPQPLPPPVAQLGPYRILEVLGRGGMGIVYLAEDSKLIRRVAVKALLPAVCADPDSHQRFLREARAAARIENDHVVPIYHVGEEGGVPYLVMPFLKGAPLDKWLEQHRELLVESIVRLGQDIARGLAAAHQQGLIHRDIKPANIWVEAPGGRAKILDFGLAREVENSGQLTQTGYVVGTPAYMAPEQACGAELDHRCDLFSLGALLYRICTGEPPFQRSTTMAMLTALAVETAKPVMALKPDLPKPLADLIMELLAKNPADRLQSAQEVVDRLQAIERGLANAPPSDDESPPASSVHCEPGLLDTRMNLPPVAADSKTAQLAVRTNGTHRTPARRWQLVLIGVGIPGLLLLAAAVIILANGGRPSAKDSLLGSVNSGPNLSGATQLTAPQQPGGLPPTYTNALGIEFVLVPKGKSWLGGGDGKLGNQVVEIVDDFYLGKYEVTQEEWEKVIPGPSASEFSRTGPQRLAVQDVSDTDLKRFPVEHVSCRLGVKQFLDNLNKHTKVAGWEYRLPTVVQWEYACRGGPMTDPSESAFNYYFTRPAQLLRSQQANFKSKEGPQRPCKVGSYPPNRLGLYDMHGNVAEWCADAHFDPDGNPARMVMGGCWRDHPGDLRAANKALKRDIVKDNGIGVRLARVRVGKEDK